MNKRENKSIRSPFFYVGDKYKLMPQLKVLFPENINTFYDVFCGGGSASINTEAKSYVLNDMDKKIQELHKLLQKNSANMNFFINKMHKLIREYGLSLSEIEKNNQEIEKLKRQYVKTYFAKYNKEAYLHLRADYNANQKQTNLLYLLLIYGFNHMIRFNTYGEFNLPVGNVDWNKNVTTALNNYATWFNNHEVKLSKGLDFETFVKSLQLTANDFLYFDPPYLITFSDYNKFWSEEDEYRLYQLLDRLNEQGVKWGLSNMYAHKGKENLILLDWSQKYNKFAIQSNYISCFDNTVKRNSKELYVTNFKRDN